MFVSESKFLAAPHNFIPHILASPPNTEALAGLITKPAVEAKLLVRLANKARVYGCEMDVDGRLIEVPDEEMGARGKIDLASVVGMYKDWIIPLTKDVEVSFLLEFTDRIDLTLQRWTILFIVWTASLSHKLMTGWRATASRLNTGEIS